jgi:hypothetical protein
MIAPLPSPHPADDALDDFVDDVLDDASRETTRAHLAQCTSCAARLAELRALLALSAAERRPVEPPAELWPLVVASTVARPQLQRQLLRSMRAPLAAAAFAVIVLSSATTAWVMTRVTADSGGAPAVTSYLEKDAAFDRALAARDHEHGPVSRERIAELRARLAATDDAIRHAPDDESLYRALADRERVVSAIRSVLGRGPAPPRAPRPSR